MSRDREGNGTYLCPVFVSGTALTAGVFAVRQHATAPVASAIPLKVSVLRGAARAIRFGLSLLLGLKHVDQILTKPCRPEVCANALLGG